MTNKKNKIKTEEQQDEKYLVEIKTAEEMRQGYGDSIEEAISDIGMEWNEVKLKGDITIIKGKDKYSRMFNARDLKQLFGNKFYRQMWAKNLKNLFNWKAK